MLKNKSNLINSLNLINKNWVTLNQPKIEKLIELKSQKLVIYTYCLSNNLLKEVLLKRGFKFILTNEVRKANLIIGLKKHLKQNYKLVALANQKNIPIYTLNQVSLYQISRLIKFISL